MPEYAYINMVLNMPRILNIKQNFEYGRILNIRALRSFLNMLEYALTEFGIYPEF